MGGFNNHIQTPYWMQNSKYIYTLKYILNKVKIMFCPKCAFDNPDDSEYCSSCGTPLNNNAVYNKASQHVQSSYILPQKSTGVGIILSFLLPGLGHLYAGLIGMGLILMVLSMVFIALAFFTFFITLVFYLILWIWGIFNVRQKINEYNEYIRRVGSPPW